MNDVDTDSMYSTTVRAQSLGDPGSSVDAHLRETSRSRERASSACGGCTASAQNRPEIARGRLVEPLPALTCREQPSRSETFVISRVGPVSLVTDAERDVDRSLYCFVHHLHRPRKPLGRLDSPAPRPARVRTHSVRTKLDHLAGGYRITSAATSSRIFVITASTTL